MRELPSNFSQEAVTAIRRRLDSVRASGLSILFAIESGSRAWGFPSPDSDYDCRFVYVRPVSDHLGLDVPRDVIEFPIEGLIDTGGWDLKKALVLALDGNAVIVEWAKSPIVYEEKPGFRALLLDLIAEIVEPAKVAYHYLGLARKQFRQIGGFSGDVRLKQLFYLIRPIVALDWMSERGFTALPPMNVVDSLAETRIPPDAAAEIRRLIEEKSRTREMGDGPVPLALGYYLEARYSHHDLSPAQPALDQAERSRRRAMAAEFYRKQVEMV